VYVIKSAAKKAKRAKSVEKPESVKATDETAPETTPAQGESVSLEDGIDHLTGTLHILRMAKELLKGVTVTR
jgi:hypothetical protein